MTPTMRIDGATIVGPIPAAPGDVDRCECPRCGAPAVRSAPFLYAVDQVAIRCSLTCGITIRPRSMI